MDPRDLKTALFCISFLRKGEVLAYVGLHHNLKDLKGLKDLKDLNDLHTQAAIATGCSSHTAGRRSWLIRGSPREPA